MFTMSIWKNPISSLVLKNDSKTEMGFAPSTLIICNFYENYEVDVCEKNIKHDNLKLFVQFNSKSTSLIFFKFI